MAPVPHEVLSEIAEYVGAESWALHLQDGGSTASGYPLDQPGNWFVVPDVSLDPDASRFSRQNPHLNLRSMACLSIHQAGERIGVLALYNLKSDCQSVGFGVRMRLLCEHAAHTLLA